MELSFDQLWQQFNWREIPNCPGRYVLMEQNEEFRTLISGIEFQRHESRFAADPVLVARFSDGGFIVYAKPYGNSVVTLNTESGFDRKLNQLKIE